MTTKIKPVPLTELVYNAMAHNGPMDSLTVLNLVGGTSEFTRAQVSGAISAMRRWNGVEVAQDGKLYIITGKRILPDTAANKKHLVDFLRRKPGLSFTLVDLAAITGISKVDVTTALSEQGDNDFIRTKLNNGTVKITAARRISNKTKCINLIFSNKAADIFA